MMLPGSTPYGDAAGRDTLRGLDVGTVPIPGVTIVLAPPSMKVGEADIVTYPDGISTNRQLYATLDPSSHIEFAAPEVIESNVRLAVQRSPSS